MIRRFWWLETGQDRQGEGKSGLTLFRKIVRKFCDLIIIEETWTSHRCRVCLWDCGGWKLSKVEAMEQERALKLQNRQTNRDRKTTDPKIKKALALKSQGWTKLQDQDISKGNRAHHDLLWCPIQYLKHGLDQDCESHRSRIHRDGSAAVNILNLFYFQVLLVWRGAIPLSEFNQPQHRPAALGPGSGRSSLYSWQQHQTTPFMFTTTTTTTTTLVTLCD